MFPSADHAMLAARMARRRDSSVGPPHTLSLGPKAVRIPRSFLSLWRVGPCNRAANAGQCNLLLFCA